MWSFFNYLNNRKVTRSGIGPLTDSNGRLISQSHTCWPIIFPTLPHGQSSHLYHQHEWWWWRSSFTQLCYYYWCPWCSPNPYLFCSGFHCHRCSREPPPLSRGSGGGKKWRIHLRSCAQTRMKHSWVSACCDPAWWSHSPAPEGGVGALAHSSTITSCGWLYLWCLASVRIKQITWERRGSHAMSARTQMSRKRSDELMGSEAERLWAL